MPYGQFQGQKIRKSIACALAVFIRPKNLYRLRKRSHYWFCRLFVVFATSPVSCFEVDWERPNALRNFWLVLFIKMNNNLADDSISRLFYYWRTCRQKLTQPNKLVLQKKEAKTHLVRHKHLHPYLLKPRPEMFNGVMMPPPGIFESLVMVKLLKLNSQRRLLFLFFRQDNRGDQPPATYIVIHPSACITVHTKPVKLQVSTFHNNDQNS